MIVVKIAKTINITISGFLYRIIEDMIFFLYYFKLYFSLGVFKDIACTYFRMDTRLILMIRKFYNLVHRLIIRYGCERTSINGNGPQGTRQSSFI
ncbi:MAG: hypothetical protein BAJALOKI3v1_1190004 [Promethearchaeota archaeon]|nr:MAG: hypothetical protein BAJALOKI3v1_1190004 [Candidatus Lokiarchaeota archaeon]